MSTIGFTGTQRGTTSTQLEKLAQVLKDLRASYDTFVHGDCIGADAEAALVARELGYVVVARPCTITSKRAFVPADQEHPPKPPLERNHNIVDDAQVLIACPGEREEVLRSGTWATIRYARKRGVNVLLIYPE